MIKGNSICGGYMGHQEIMAEDTTLCIVKCAIDVRCEYHI